MLSWARKRYSHLHQAISASTASRELRQLTLLLKASDPAWRLLQGSLWQTSVSSWGCNQVGRLTLWHQSRPA